MRPSLFLFLTHFFLAQSFGCLTSLLVLWLLLRHNTIVQVTHASVRIVDCKTLELVHEWKPPANGSITVAATNPSQILIALGGGNLVFLNIEPTTLVIAAETKLDQEVACLDISPIAKTGANAPPTSAEYAAVGMWIDMSVRVLALPTLTESVRHVLNADNSNSNVGDVISRSVMFHVFGTQTHLLIGLGDGRLFNFHFNVANDTANTSTLSDLKRVTLGTQPIGLKRFRARDKEYVFAASDRPTVVYYNNGKVLYSNVNKSEVTTIRQLVR